MSTSGPGWRPKSSAILSYGSAVVLVAAAVVAAHLLDAFLQTQPIVSLFLCTILFVAWVGGTGPGLLAAGLAIMAFDYFFLPPANSFDVVLKDIPRLTLFAMAALFVIWLTAAQRKIARTLRRTRDDLREKVEELQGLNKALLAESAERQHAEQKIRLAERELQLMIDTIPALVATYRPDGSREFVNQTGRNFSGLVPKELNSERWKVALHPDDRELAESKWRESLATGEPLQLEYRIRRADGEYRWLMARRVPLRDEKGAVIRWYGVGFDIEDRKRTEDALRRSEAGLAKAERELQLTIDTIPVLAAAYKPDGSLDFVNQTFRTYTGLSPESINEAARDDVVHPDDLAMIEDIWRAHLASGEPFETEQRVRRADGEYRRHWVRRVPLRGERGEVIRWYGVGLDIEDRKRAEAALRQSEAHLAEAERELQITIDMVPALVATYGPDGARDFVNQTWRDYTGLSLEDAKGRSWSIIAHPDDTDASEKEWRACLAAGKPFHMAHRLRRHDGEYRWHLVDRVPRRDEKGNVVKWYAVGFEIEEQKRAEDALRQSQANLAEAELELRVTLDSIPTMAWRTRPDGFAEYLNKRWLDYTGVPFEQAVGWGWPSVIHPDDAAGLMDAWQGMLAAEKPAEVEARIRRFDGEYRLFLFRAEPLFDETGKVVRWYGTNTDIEDRRRAEIALRESEADLAAAKQALQATIDTIPTLVASYWPDGSRDFVNQAWQSFTGISQEQARGKAWSITVHPDDIATGEAKWRESLATGEPLHLEQRFRRADGEFRWHMVDRVPLRDEKGNVTRWYSVSYDIEDRKRAEAALRQNEAYLDEAQGLSHTGSFGWNTVSGDIVWSKETYQIFGVERTVTPTIDLVIDRTHPDDREFVARLNDRMARENADFDFEHRLLLPNGAVKHLHVRAHRVKFESGQEEVIGALMDVTAARKAQEELHLAQTELAHASRVATLGEMTASIAHEVNQPLAGIVTNGEASVRWLTRDAPDIDEALRGLRRIVSEAERAGRVIRRIRDLSKKAEPEMAQLDINTIIEEVVTLVHHEAISRRVSLRLQLASGLPLVRGDRVQLQQVIINLVVNGIQAMAAVTDRPRLIFIRTQPHESGQVLVGVQDVGVGVEPDSLNRLFSAFYTTKPDGMGMGLSICRSIIEAHGGRVWASRNTGPGMTFQFTLSAHRQGDGSAGSHGRVDVLAAQRVQAEG